MENREKNEFFIKNAFVAQLVEHFTCNEDVAGSIPVKSSKLSCGVIGNTSGFDPEESRFEPWRDI